MTDPSFYYAIFKKFQASSSLGTGGHLSPPTANDFAGGFSLRSTGDKLGIHGGLSGTQGQLQYGLMPGFMPLAAGDPDPTHSAIWVMLNAALTDPLTLVPFNGLMLPPMPLAGTDGVSIWQAFNAGPGPRPIDAFGTWIANGQNDDTPQDPKLDYATVLQKAPPAIPGLPGTAAGVRPVLFVSSFPGDDGRRAGDGEPMDPGTGHVPANYWATSPIVLTDNTGKTISPGPLLNGTEHYVAAVIGNNGNWPAGSIVGGPSPTKITVQCDAQAFNTAFSPGVALPSLGNLDVTDSNAIYEQYFLEKQTQDVVGFRFNVDKVFAGLAAAVESVGLNMGGSTGADWVKAGHPCVKVYIIGGEQPVLYPPPGGVLTATTADKAFPNKDRHVAQHNLRHFGFTLMGATQGIHWTNFVMAQVGAGMNGLAPQHGLPGDALRLYVAITSFAYERYIAKGGSFRGFERVADPSSKPFPEAVILRQTHAEARIEVPDHARDLYLGMSIGLEGDAARIRQARLHDISMVHTAHDGSTAGGFTIRLYETPRELS